MGKRILVIGAGAVGQVYGRHLAAAGHAVSFFVKPVHRAALSDGMPLHRLRHWRQQHEHWRDFTLISEVSDVAGRDWDQIWLCMSSDALRSPLTEALLAAAGQATVVCLQPGPEDAALVRRQLGQPAQLVQGLITFVSYQSPLPNLPGPSGIAYWLPPATPMLLSGAAERVQAVAAALKAGGIRVRVVADLHRAAGGADGLLIPLVAALELNDWRMTGFAGSEAFALGRAAAEETLSLLAREQGAKISLTRLALRPLAARAALRLAPAFVPLPLEPYLHYHFAKVGVQTRQMLASYIAIGEKHGLPVANLQRLRAALP